MHLIMAVWNGSEISNQLPLSLISLWIHLCLQLEVYGKEEEKEKGGLKVVELITIITLLHVN